MIYWIEHAPNPWVRAAAIVVLGAIAYFYPEDTSVPMDSWLGGYGSCEASPAGVEYE